MIVINTQNLHINGANRSLRCLLPFQFSMKQYCNKSSKDAMLGLFGPLYYFSRLEISFALSFENDWLSCERKSFLSDVLSAESGSMDQKRLYVETGNTSNKPLRKRPTSTGSSRKSLFGSPSSGKSVG